MTLKEQLKNIENMRRKFPEDKNLMEACDWREAIIIEQLKKES